MLSHSKGQIIHLLLTRPPLSYTRIDPKVAPAYNSARLACVRHAASVHPEPGSNSQVNCFPEFASVKKLASTKKLFMRNTLAVFRIRNFYIPLLRFCISSAQGPIFLLWLFCFQGAAKTALLLLFLPFSLSQILLPCGRDKADYRQYLGACQAVF